MNQYSIRTQEASHFCNPYLSLPVFSPAQLYPAMPGPSLLLLADVVVFEIDLELSIVLV